MGKLRKVRIWHEKRHPFAGWHLATVRPIALSAGGSCLSVLCSLLALNTKLDME